MSPTEIRPTFRSVVLVCKACEKRAKGPKGVSARDVARRLKGAAREAGVERARVVLTSCLGACPKKAMTVAAMRPGRPPAMAALGRRDDPAAAVALLFGPQESASNSTSSAPSPT